MADVAMAGPSGENLCQTQLVDEENNQVEEPVKKKPRLENERKKKGYNLEDRLNGILCCAVCLDLPNVAVYQCTNGHLMCAGCFSHLLADARLKDESATCPNCRCELNKNVCSRNLAVEKAISELPSECQYCSEQLPRSGIDYHERELCQERLVSCTYERIGCPWRGPFHELQGHTTECAHPKRTGDEIMESLQVIDNKRDAEIMLYQSIFNLLSFEKIAFSDLQLRPYRTDDFLPRLYYETSRFTAFNNQWVVKSHVNDNRKDPNLCAKRSLAYQVALKSKITSPIRLHFVALKGPYGDISVNPAIHEFEFSNENTETGFKELPIPQTADCNKLLAAKTINMRLIMFQVSK